jgi:hypothetical protein
MLNSLVDRRFSSEEYQDLQNDRLTNLAAAMIILMNIFVADPQSFTTDTEQIKAKMPHPPFSLLLLSYHKLTQALNQEMYYNKKDI